MDLRKSLIGNIKKCTADTDFDLNSPEVQAKLAKPLKWSEAVSRTVCTRCGEIAEINEVVAKRLLKFMGFLGTKPEIVLNKDGLRNWYFTLNYCNACKSGREKGKVRLVRSKETGG